MKATREEQLKESIKKMKALNLGNDVIDQLNKDHVVCVTKQFGMVCEIIIDKNASIENCGDYDIDGATVVEVVEAIKDLEQRGFFVYYCMLDNTECGVMLSCLYTYNEKEDWDSDLRDIEETLKGEDIPLYSYVANLTHPHFSEVGRICIRKIADVYLRVC